MVDVAETKELFLIKDELFYLEEELRSKVRKLNQDLLAQEDVARRVDKINDDSSQVNLTILCSLTTKEKVKLQELVENHAKREIELEQELEKSRKAFTEIIQEIRYSDSQVPYQSFMPLP
jgi:cell division protein ZapA (FtsZ GTPase activity inhibitor)